MDYYKQQQVEGLKKLRAIIMDLPKFAAEFFVGIAERTSVLTRINYAYDLRIFFDYLKNHVLLKDVSEITLSDLDDLVTVTDLEAFIQYLAVYEFRDGQNVNHERGKARKLFTIRSFYKYFFNKEKLKANTAAKLILPKLHSKEIVRLDVDEIVKLLDQVESGENLSKKQKDYHSKLKKRDLAMLTLFLGSGIRISECVGLNIDDIDFKNNSFKVTRKGGNQSILYFSDEIKAPLLDYVDERTTDESIDKNETALFLSTQKRRISPRAVENLVKKYSQIITPLKRITPHKLRSTYGTALYRETNDIYVVAEVLGHRDINTTKKHYAAMSEDLKRSAANKVKLREDDD